MTQPSSTRKTLGVVLFPEFETLDVFGPLQMFGMLPEQLNIVLTAEQSGLVLSTHGQPIFVEYTLQSAPHLDYLLVPGGKGTRKEVYNHHLIHWIKTRSMLADLTLSVCTGAALLAKAGVLDGLKATSNKLAFDWVVEQGPKVEWIKQARWVDAGTVITSAGISAGIDMSLYVIARLFGDKVRDELALRAEYKVQRDPNGA